MCDYSLEHDVRSRHAAAGDTLVLSRYGSFGVRAFGRPEDGSCVTCLPFGAKLEVTRPGKAPEAAFFGHNDSGMWRDGLIFESRPNAVVSLQQLELGTTAAVVALPLAATPMPAPRARARLWAGRL